MDTQTEQDVIDPQQLRVFRDENQNLCAELVGRGRWTKVTVRLGFPYSDPDHYIFLMHNEEEIGMLRDLSGLDAESQQLIRAALDKRYYIPRITRVLSVHETSSATLWVVETDRGQREFITRDRHNFRRIKGSDLIIVDVDGNRFRVPRDARFDVQSQRLLDLYT